MAKIMLTYGVTTDEWITGISRRATADRIMINNFTSSSDAASSNARVPAFLVTASFVPSAVGIDDTLWPTGWWHPFVSGQTRADGLSVNGSALAVRTTG